MKLSPLSAISLIFLIIPVFVARADDPQKREPAHVMSFRGAPWLERDTRDKEEQPYKVIGAMKLKEGDVVADIGVGSGYYARKIARIVGEKGRVYGVDIQPEMLDILMENCEKHGIENIRPVLGEFNDPKLEKESIDWMILADVYHEFSDPEAMLAKMLDALKPTGKICLLEYRLKGETARHIKTEHRMSVEQVKAEWLPAGFELLELEEFLPSQHLFIFGKAKSNE
ncbi:MAG: class I SAM-dependent methyltransferase [Candidatus Hydrogenedentota bacterium]